MTCYSDYSIAIPFLTFKPCFGPKINRTLPMGIGGFRADPRRKRQRRMPGAMGFAAGWCVTPPVFSMLLWTLAAVGR